MPSVQAFYTNKTVIVTGAASGIGKALAKVFASYGANLALCDRDGELLVATAEALIEEHNAASVITREMDVADPQAWQSFVNQAYTQFGHIDICINNAGIEGTSAPVWASDFATLERVMAVNFYGVVHGTRSVLPYLIDRPWAAIVNVSSIFGMIGAANAADYCASKFAVRGYTEAFRAELAEIYPHIQIQLVHPGGISTNIARRDNSQSFKRKFLTTAPQKIAEHIALRVMRNQARIVYGNQSGLVHMASRLLPLNWLAKLVGKQMRQLDMQNDYRLDHPGFQVPEKKVDK
ncbi:SDR family oxidoreductase [Alteromonas sp. ASW11-36]|uniref:SDR family oxidoreductase n=1 Tax=Alteromonas arenosi TaxID=3055817 RepID=A0ABT7SXC7_9ALTE|nr:SDR family oxidoreductase [Alteromonas sp. ASW11-36]MDM7860843.1 SDR family oxidoreductase [Alteromonas sp. ASW11-36]